MAAAAPPPPAAANGNGNHAHDHHHDHDDDAALAFATLAIHGGQRPDPATGAIMPPISVSSTYVQPSPGVTHAGFEYSRSHNPTRYALERAVASLEGSPLTEADDVTRGGFAFASGLAAEATVLELLDAGATVLCGDDVYGGTYRLMHNVRARSAKHAVVRVDTSDTAAVAAALEAHAPVGMLWVETPTNPTLKLADIAALVRAAEGTGALVVVDNTFATPALTRPLQLGADIVLSSSTKYIGGHSDAVGGVVATRRADLASRLRYLQNAVGAVLAPFDAYLTLRGAKTLALRVARHCDNAAALARRLQGHAAVERVVYPGLPSHPQHALAARQMRLESAAPSADGDAGGGGGGGGAGKAAAAAARSGGGGRPSAPAFGGMIAVHLRGGLPASRAFLERLRLFALAESLGGVESLAEHPAIMTHASIPAADRAALGITDGFVRLSVGVEHVDDLWADLAAALDAAAEAAAATAGGKAAVA